MTKKDEAPINLFFANYLMLAILSASAGVALGSAPVLFGFAIGSVLIALRKGWTDNSRLIRGDRKGTS